MILETFESNVISTLEPETITSAWNNQTFRRGQKVYFYHCDGFLHAEILDFNRQHSKVKLRISNWLGTHWEGIDKIKHIGT